MLTLPQVREILSTVYARRDYSQASQEHLWWVKERLVLAVQKLQAGEAIDCGDPMGSCQCGPVGAAVWIDNQGNCVCRCRGERRWANWEGPAEKCRVSFVGEKIREIALAYKAMPVHA